MDVDLERVICENFNLFDHEVAFPSEDSHSYPSIPVSFTDPHPSFVEPFFSLKLSAT
jgi:hypothetical protein